LTQPSSSQTHIPTHSSSALLSSLLRISSGFSPPFKSRHLLQWARTGGKLCLNQTKTSAVGPIWHFEKFYFFVDLRLYNLIFNLPDIRTSLFYVFAHLPEWNECLYVEFIFK
jgi:hypothetical protein